TDAATLEQGMRLSGLIAITDPPRSSAAATVAACRSAGIIPVLITGDHPVTARAIATDLGILEPGTDVVDCRELSGMDQAAVPAAEEGRRVYANIRRFLLYGLAGGTAEIAVMLVGPMVGLPLPLLPSQILWINLLTHGLPGVALGSEPVDPDAMSRPPRPPAE